MAGHVDHLPPDHVVAIVQQQVRSHGADPEHPVDHLLHPAAFGRELTAGQYRRVQLVDRHPGAGPPAQLRCTPDVVGVPVSDDDQDQILCRPAQCPDGVQGVPRAPHVDGQQPVVGLHHVPVRHAPSVNLVDPRGGLHDITSRPRRCGTPHPQHITPRPGRQGHASQHTDVVSAPGPKCAFRGEGGTLSRSWSIASMQA